MTKILSCLVIVAAAIGSANSGTSDWIGGSGSWSVGANWQEEPPAAGDTAVLGNVQSGTRTVTMDQSDAVIQKLSIDQQSADAVNKFVLGADMHIDRTSGNDLHTPFVISAVATNAVHVDLNGHAFRIDGGTGYNDTEVRLGGWWTMGAGSLLDFVQHGHHSAQEFINEGLLEQKDSEISYRFVVDMHNTTQNGGRRRWVNNGTWTMDHANFTFDAHLTNGGGVQQPGPYGYLNDCENNGLLVMRNASTNTFATLTNSGSMVLEDQSVLGPGSKGNATIVNAPGGEIQTTGAVTVYNNVGGGSTANLANGGRMTVGTDETQSEFRFPSTSLTFTNRTTGVLSVSAGSRMSFEYTGVQGGCLMVNEGLVDQSGEVLIDWAATANNNGVRQFVNSGKWTLHDDAELSVTSSLGLASIWGFSAPANVINEGSLELERGAHMGFNALSNDGEMTFGENACLGSRIATIRETKSYINRGVIDVTGQGVFIGQSLPVDNGNETTFDQNAALDGSKLEPLLAVGTNDTVAADLTIASGAGCTVKFNAGTVKVGALASLTVASLQTGETSGRVADIFNYATLVQKGAVVYRPRGATWSRIYNYGSWIVDTSDAAPARLMRGMGDETSGYGSVFNNNGVFGGCGALVFSDRTARAANTFWLLTTYGGAELLVGQGGLRLTGGQIKFAVSGEAVPRIVYDLGESVDGFGGLAIDGDNSLYEQQSTELEVVLKFPPKTRGWAGRHTLRIVTAPNVRSNNNRISSVRVECEGREDIEVGTPVYGSTTIDVTVNVPTVGFMIIVR